MSSLLSVGILSIAKLKCVIEETVEGAAPRKHQRGSGGGGASGGRKGVWRWRGVLRRIRRRSTRWQRIRRE
jgi:hypothetical protein